MKKQPFEASQENNELVDFKRECFDKSKIRLHEATDEDYEDEESKLVATELHPQQLLSVHRKTICRLESTADSHSNRCTTTHNTMVTTPTPVNTSASNGEQKKSMVEEMLGNASSCKDK